MALCGLLALLLGYVVGLRFRVVIILPLEMAALAAAAVVVVVGRLGFGEACFGFLVFSAAVQMGYGLALACPLPVRILMQRRPIKA